MRESPRPGAGGTGFSDWPVRSLVTGWALLSLLSSHSESTFTFEPEVGTQPALSLSRPSAGLLLLGLACSCRLGRPGPPRGTVGEAERSPLPVDASIRLDPETGTIIQLKAANLAEKLPQGGKLRKALSNGEFGEASVELIQAFRGLFKLRTPRSELLVEKIGPRDNLGHIRVGLLQQYQGYRIWGCNLLVHFDSSNHPTIIQGRYIPTPDQVSTLVSLSADEICRNLLKREEYQGCACKQEGDLVFFPLESRTAVRLSYRIRLEGVVWNQWELIVDAADGAVLNQLDLIQTGSPLHGNQ